MNSAFQIRDRNLVTALAGSHLPGREVVARCPDSFSVRQNPSGLSDHSPSWMHFGADDFYTGTHWLIQEPGAGLRDRSQTVTHARIVTRIEDLSFGAVLPTSQTVQRRREDGWEGSYYLSRPFYVWR